MSAGARVRVPGRATTLVVLGLLLAVAAVLLLGQEKRSGDPLHPDNPGPAGAKALAEVLAEAGVEVTVANGAEELRATRPGAGTTVLVTGVGALGTSTATDLQALAAGSRLVVAGAGQAVTDLFAAPAPYPVTDPEATARCRLLGLEPGLRLEVDRARAHDTTRGCFPTAEGHLLALTEGAVLLGADEILSNEQVLRADNAAIALRLLGSRDRLVWYLPRLTDLGGGDRVGLWTLLPRWLAPVLVLLALVVVAVVAWRGRRLGPLEVEPLPVPVRAIETTVSAGRLYHRAGDRRHAAALLRNSSIQRLTRTLRLPPGSDSTTVATAAAVHADRDPAEVAALLDPDQPPPDDRRLVQLAGDLARLDREVQQQ